MRALTVNKPAVLHISCEAVDDSGRFSARFTGRGEDTSPAFRVRGIPDAAQSFAIALRDKSHPVFGTMTHWIIWNLPVNETVRADIPHGAHVRELDAAQGIAYG